MSRKDSVAHRLAREIKRLYAGPSRAGGREANRHLPGEAIPLGSRTGESVRHTFVNPIKPGESVSSMRRASTNSSKAWREEVRARDYADAHYRTNPSSQLHAAQ